MFAYLESLDTARLRMDSSSAFSEQAGGRAFLLSFTLIRTRSPLLW